MRTLAIGDIHGCLNAFQTLMQAVSIQPNDTLVTLGDYIDNGPDSNGVINRILQLRKKCRLVSLLGNHEQMMLEARESESKFKEWLRCGGKATLLSYRRIGETGTLDDVPRAHWNFLREMCVPYFETSTHLFVHANAYPDMALDAQPDYMLRWEQISDGRPHESGKTIICGHTTQKSGKILNLGHAICIDTNPAGGKWLTCLDVSTMRFWQSNEAGEVQSGQL